MGFVILTLQKKHIKWINYIYTRHKNKFESHIPNETGVIDPHECGQKAVNPHLICSYLGINMIDDRQLIKFRHLGLQLLHTLWYETCTP